MKDICSNKRWQPQLGPQAIAIDAGLLADELLFGGARGGGKTDFLLADFLADVGRGYQNAWRGVIFRKTYPQCEELISRSQEMFPTCFPGAVYHHQQKIWIMPHGETLKIRALENERDADKFQGHSYTWIGWDELGNWPNSIPYRKLKACLRSWVSVKGKRIRATANPGGSGHDWVKKYFAIDRFPNGNILLCADEDHGERIFIKSRLQDNRILIRNDPNYAARLRQVGNVQLVRAWLNGDWNSIAGAFFTEWDNEKHVVRRFVVPESWPRFISFDWGSSSPFSAGWWAIVGKEYHISGNCILPRGSLLRYQEWYGADSSGQGLKLTAEQVACEILARTVGGKISYAVADPSIFRVDGGPSIAERMAKIGLRFRAADNARIAGWDQLRARLRGDGNNPTIFCFDDCVDSIRTIPAMIHASHLAEDIDSNCEDHAADDWRYACMSRPYLPQLTNERSAHMTDMVTYNDLHQLTASPKNWRI